MESLFGVETIDEFVISQSLFPRLVRKIAANCKDYRKIMQLRKFSLIKLQQYYAER